MLRKAIVVCALALPTMPATAATYVGHLSGVVTNGRYFYTEPYDFTRHYFDISGAAVKVDFTVTEILNYDDGYWVFPHFVEILGTYEVGPVNSIGYSGIFSDFSSSYIGSEGSNYSFAGNQLEGGFFQRDYGIEAHINWSLLKGSLSIGSGSLSSEDASFEYPIGTTADFNFTRGYVALVPEPSVWALLILGFGAVGFGVRRRSQRSIARFAGALSRLRP